MKRYRFLILLGVAFLVRLTWMLVFYRTPSADDLQYARYMARGMEAVYDRLLSP